MLGDGAQDHPGGNEVRSQAGIAALRALPVHWLPQQQAVADSAAVAAIAPFYGNVFPEGNANPLQNRQRPSGVINYGNDHAERDAASRLPEHQNEEARMQLSEEDRQFACNIKRAIEADPELDNLSDYWYAQLALVELDDVEAALDRARGLQHFREEYGIVDNYTEGRSLLHAMINLYPRHLLSYNYNERDARNVLIMDFAQFETSSLSSPEKMRSWIGGAYYLNQSMTCDLEGIRQGIVALVECEGYSWNQSIDFRTLRKIYTELETFYPMQVRQMKHFHTGVIFNMVASMLKRFLPSDYREAFQVGCQFEERLDSIYMTPSVEVANQRLLSRLCTCLRERYRHEESFVL